MRNKSKARGKKKNARSPSSRSRSTPAPVAVYAGTFDPITNGHIDIIERACPIFDELIIGVADSTEKQTLFSTADRAEMIRASLRRLKFGRTKVTVSVFDGLLVDFAKKLGAKVIVRGLRAVSDYEYEAQMAMINRQLAPEIETVFLMTSDHCSFISSSIVRQVAKYGGDLSGLVPKEVAKRLQQIY